MAVLEAAGEPATMAVLQAAGEPATMARSPTRERSCRREGASPQIPPNWMATDEKSAEPGRAQMGMITTLPPPPAPEVLPLDAGS